MFAVCPRPIRVVLVSAGVSGLARLAAPTFKLSLQLERSRSAWGSGFHMAWFGFMRFSAFTQGLEVCGGLTKFHKAWRTPAKILVHV